MSAGRKAVRIPANGPMKSMLAQKREKRTNTSETSDIVKIPPIKGSRQSKKKKVTDQTLTGALDCSSMSGEAPFGSFDPELDENDSAKPCIDEYQDTTVVSNRDPISIRDTANKLNICCSCGVTINFLYPYLDELGSLRPETVKNQRSLRRGGLPHAT